MSASLCFVSVFNNFDCSLCTYAMWVYFACCVLFIHVIRYVGFEKGVIFGHDPYSETVLNSRLCYNTVVLSMTLTAHQHSADMFTPREFPATPQL